MDLWSRARVFAEEAAKRSQEAAKRSQELISRGTASFPTDLVSDAARRSRELAAEASRRADDLRSEAIRAAGHIKSLASDIPLPPIPRHGDSSTPDLQRFGVTDELREFVKGVTLSTFRDFPLQDEPDASETPTVSNVRQDLNEWQAKHAMLVLSSVKEISNFRYELCPRHMKERKFWRIYFILVNSYVAPYEKQYMEEQNYRLLEGKKEHNNKEEATTSTSKADEKDGELQNKVSTSSSAEHDLDVFLLGDHGSSDENSDDGDDGDDDFIVDFDEKKNASGLESDEEDGKKI